MTALRAATAASKHSIESLVRAAREHRPYRHHPSTFEVGCLNYVCLRCRATNAI